MKQRARKRPPFIAKCHNCGKSHKRYVSEWKAKHPFCSARCKSDYQRVHNQGYYRGLTRDGKTIREHRYVMEQKLGRKLLPSEHVHHANGKIRDNRPENLELINHGKHSQMHHPITWDVERIGKMVSAGASIQAVAKLVGKTQKSVKKALARRGIFTSCKGGRPMQGSNAGALRQLDIIHQFS